VYKPDEMLAYCSFQRNSVKWWKKLFFHLCDLAILNTHILHQMKMKENFGLFKFIKKVAECLVSNTRTEITELAKSWAGRLVGRGQYPYRILAKS
jgi:hypothetical protein